MMNILNFANPFKVKFKAHLNIGVADVFASILNVGLHLDWHFLFQLYF
jgi:hypothetical protein